MHQLLGGKTVEYDTTTIQKYKINLQNKLFK